MTCSAPSAICARFAAGNAREMLQPFIDRKLLVLEAKAKGLDQHPDVVASVQQVRDRRLVERLYGEVTGDVSISEEELRSHFHQSGLHKKREVRASHIQVGSLEEIRAVQEQLRQGADFAALAREQSLDRTSAGQRWGHGFLAGGRSTTQRVCRRAFSPTGRPSVRTVPQLAGNLPPDQSR